MKLAPRRLTAKIRRAKKLMSGKRWFRYTELEGKRARRETGKRLTRMLVQGLKAAR
jgi:hypothetical protein